MQIQVKFFGRLTDITGSSELTVHDIHDTAALVAELNRRYPALQQMPYNLAVEKDIIKDNTPLQHNNTVALLPPYAGG